MVTVDEDLDIEMVEKAGKELRMVYVKLGGRPSKPGVEGREKAKAMDNGRYVGEALSSCKRTDGINAAD